MISRTIKVLEAAFLAALIFVAIEAGIFMRRAQTELPGVAADYRRLAEDAVGVTSEARLTLKQTQQDSRTTADNVAAATGTLNADLTALAMLELSANDLLNEAKRKGGLLADRAGDTLDELHADAAELAPAINRVDEAAEKLPPLLDDAKTTGDNVAAMSSQGVGVMTDSHTETTLLVGQTRKAFAPKNKFLAIARMAGSGSVTLAELWYYLTHIH